MLLTFMVECLLNNFIYIYLEVVHIVLWVKLPTIFKKQVSKMLAILN
jgi:hypothetical protein